MSSFRKWPHNRRLGVPRPASPGQHGSCGRVAASVIGAHKSQRGRRDGSIPPLPSVSEARRFPPCISVIFPRPTLLYTAIYRVFTIKRKKLRNGHRARLLPAYDANLPSGFCSSLFFFLSPPSTSTLPFMLLFRGVTFDINLAAAAA